LIYKPLAAEGMAVPVDTAYAVFFEPFKLYVLCAVFFVAYF